MPTRIELLKQAGFSDAEIGDWATAERERMHGQGFTDDEIDADFGVTRPPKEVPEAFIERLKQGNAASRIAGAAGDYAQHYFGDAPLGFSPANQEALRKLGMVGDIVIPAAKPVDAVLRAVPAGIAALGAGFGQALEEAGDAAFGPGPQAKGKAARDFAQFAQIAALLSGSGRTGPAPSAKVTAAPAIVLPRAEDFRNAAAAISGTPASFSTEQKLLRLWTEHGIAPAEVAQAAARDRTVAADLLSDSDRLPEAYVGAPRETAATGESSRAAGPAPADRAAVAPEGGPGVTPTEDRPRAGQAEGEGQAGPEPAMIAESRDVAMYRPPRIWQRPFKWDYRNPPETDITGRLLRDIEGRRLTARFVAGRRFPGEADEALSAADMKKAMQQLNIQLLETPDVPGQDPSAVGLYRGDLSKTGPKGDIFIKSTMSPEDVELATAHEFGHLLDHFTGIVSRRLTPAEIEELRKVYTTLRAGPRKTPYPQPEDFGYDRAAVPRELTAEGFRAYLQNPNYFKTVAPRAAARFREAVNSSRRLKRVIQLNSLGPAGLIGAGLAIGSEDRDEQ